MKTIDITAKEWFDKVNGNSYFSAQITIDYSLPTQQTIYLPFQYGYGEQYTTEVFHTLKELNLIDSNTSGNSFWRYCQTNNIILRTNKIDKQLKRDVISFGKK